MTIFRFLDLYSILLSFAIIMITIYTIFPVVKYRNVYRFLCKIKSIYDSHVSLQAGEINDKEGLDIFEIPSMMVVRKTITVCNKCQWLNTVIT